MLCTLYIFWYSNASIEWGICTEWEWARARTFNSRKDTTSANTRAKTLWIELITGAFMKQNGTGIDHNKIMPHDECIGFDWNGCATSIAICFLCGEQTVRYAWGNKVEPRRIKVRDNAIALKVGQRGLERLDTMNTFIAWSCRTVNGMRNNNKIGAYECCVCKCMCPSWPRSNN